MYCSAEVAELQLIESIFHVEVSSSSSDVLTVCPGECADKIRKASDVIIRDEPFKERM